MHVVSQRRWDLLVPAEAKAAYKNATNNPVVVNLGDEPQTMRATIWDVDLTAHLPQVRWSGLDALPRLTTLRWSGPDHGLTEAIAARPLIVDLIWNDPPSTIDLSATHLTAVTISGNGLRRLRLPPGLMNLRLTSDPPQVVEAAEDGRWIRLLATSPGHAIPSGLHGVRRLDLQVAGDLSLTGLGAAADLEELTITWTGPHGQLLDAVDLHGLRRLHTLQLTDAYGVEASSLPRPGTPLRRLSIGGIRRSQAKLVKARYKGTPVWVTVWGAKSDTWLAANVSNPLRDWVDDDEQAGTAACKAYAAALRTIDRLPSGDAMGTNARPVLHKLIAELNAIDERYEIIDTLRREQAADAFFDLARRANIPDSEAADWLDEWRDF
ncbi:hypothetical protein ACFFHJ_00640 [Planotetraspora thailandica]|uniref:hypothetical protein n=1 Tax=Planotetraspora thailandica TaxID=487172 RepID=UPI001EF2B8B9|nr:hypothetical protein [Planotetraspora thailandica]